MMFRKNKMLLNIVIDFVMLTAMALVSISGFILEIVIPSRHAVKFQGATPWSSQLLGLGRHDWGEIHLWAGIVLVILLAIHILLHINMVSAFIKKKYPNHILRVLLYILFLMLLITASQSITLYIRDRLACLFIKTAIISPAVFLGRTNLNWGI